MIFNRIKGCVWLLVWAFRYLKLTIHAGLIWAGDVPGPAARREDVEEFKRRMETHSVMHIEFGRLERFKARIACLVSFGREPLQEDYEAYAQIIEDQRAGGKP